MEEERGNVTAEQIAVFFASLIATIDGIAAYLVLNMDEMDHQDWADWNEQTSHFPVTVEKQQVFLPVPRAGKQITLIVCIAKDGSHQKPTVTMPRKIVDSDIVSTGLTSEKRDIDKQPNDFIVNELVGLRRLACLS
jgi:hypothetical protein